MRSFLGKYKWWIFPSVIILFLGVIVILVLLSLPGPNGPFKYAVF